jgi:hypothetical protein
MEDLPPFIAQTTEQPSEEPFQLTNPPQQHDDPTGNSTTSRPTASNEHGPK